MADETSGLAAWLRRLIMRSPLNDAERQRVLALQGRIVEVPAGRDLVEVGRKVETVSLVLSGLLAQVGQSRSGEQQIVALHLPGEMANLPAAMLPNPCCAQTALETSTVLKVSISSILDLLRASPRLAAALWCDTCVDAAVAEQWLIRNGLSSGVVRLAHLLCEMSLRCEVLGGSRDRLHLGLRQTQLGSALSLTPVHTNRMMRDLRERGVLIAQGRDLLFPDWEALAQVGSFDPTYLHLEQ